jgi:predicted nucleic acid-binding protein
VNDALAYLVMVRRGVREVYTFDRHFERLDVVVVTE